VRIVSTEALLVCDTTGEEPNDLISLSYDDRTQSSGETAITSSFPCRSNRRRPHFYKKIYTGPQAVD
jgi:hypothetical protein